MTTTTKTDGDLIASSRDDPHLFAELFGRHFRSVHGFLARRAGQQVADDLAADVFTTAFAGRDRFDPAYSDARPWLYGIARNLLAAERRRVQRHEVVTSRWATSCAGPAADPAEDADARLDAARSGVSAALHDLPEVERDVLLLVAWEGLTPAEAALTLGIPAGTARSRLHRAREAMRRHLLTRTQEEPVLPLPTSPLMNGARR